MPLNTITLIPAYKPTAGFPDFVRHLADSSGGPVVIVNDGSGEAHAEDFAAVSRLPNVTVLEHAVNRGKGAALKTGLAHIARHYPQVTGVVTADADGQHLVTDILKVSAMLEAHPTDLILGVRAFDRSVPWRSKFGNTLTRYAFHLVTGHRLTDTQTGLRAIPLGLVPALLQLPSNRYEYELDMLLFCKTNRRRMIEVPIETVYIDDNRSSHFDPVRDSLRIYGVLFRPALLFCLGGMLDFLVFIAMFALTDSVAGSQAAARACALAVIGPRWRLPARKAWHIPLKGILRGLAFGMLSGGASYLALKALMTQTGMPLAMAKANAEIATFLAAFVVQRLFFSRTESNGSH